PTLARIVRVTLPEDLLLDGRDVLAYLENPKVEKLPLHPFYYYSRNGNLEAIRYGSWKLHIGKETSAELYSADGEFSAKLFDLDSDIGEDNDVSGQNPEVVSKLRGMINSFDLEN